MKTETFRIDHPLARGSEVTSQDLWDFPDGLIGLPEHHRFALVDLPDVPPFRLLASVDDPGFGIVVVDPAFSFRTTWCRSGRASSRPSSSGTRSS